MKEKLLGAFVTGLLLVIPSSIVCFIIISDFAISDRTFEKFIDNNKTIKEMYFEKREDSYKLKYTDWKRFEKDVKNDRRIR